MALGSLPSMLRGLLGRSARAPLAGLQTNVLFVCMGNICRSPTAEAVFRHHVELAGLGRRLGCDSAGTIDSHRGTAPDARAQIAARRRGYDLASLRARCVSAEDFTRFELILAMDRTILATLESLGPPESAPRLRLFMEFARRHDAREVPDPYYGNARGFDVVLDMIEDACEGLLTHLRDRT